MKDKLLITGGCGYIGSHFVSLYKDVYDIVVVDKQYVNIFEGVTYYTYDMMDFGSLEEVFNKEKINKVIHFAGAKSVEESTRNLPAYTMNIIITDNLMKCCLKHNVKQVVFSSTAALYKSKNGACKETDKLEFTNPYAEIKYMCERLLQYYYSIHRINYVSLRYFNVAGHLFDCSETNKENIFPKLIEHTENGEIFYIYGYDYDTRDGTAVRDYIHIRDLVDAHEKALYLSSPEIINLGTNKGTSVKEIVEAWSRFFNISYRYTNRRAGDNESTIADISKAKEVLNWTPLFDIIDIIKSYKRFK